MKAMLLAAGNGKRLAPLTDHTPKPLLEVNGRPLIDYHLSALARAGFDDVVVNVSHLRQQLEDYLADGSRWGLHIDISVEPDDPLETAGGIIKALPLLGSDPFIVINADTFTMYPFAAPALPPERLAHLVLVPNPPHNPGGDFCLDGASVQNNGPTMHTFAGIGLYAPEFFQVYAADIIENVQNQPLAPLLRRACSDGKVSGELFDGVWLDVGTVERLQEATIAAMQHPSF